jgi:6,7-dimethyl-8-ribityllumazine synthase
MSHYKLKEKNYDNLDKNIKIAFVTAEFNHNFTSELEAINKAFLQNH